MPSCTWSVVFDQQTNLYLVLLLQCSQEVERITICKNNEDMLFLPERLRPAQLFDQRHSLQESP